MIKLKYNCLKYLYLSSQTEVINDKWFNFYLIMINNILNEISLNLNLSFPKNIATLNICFNR